MHNPPVRPFESDATMLGLFAEAFPLKWNLVPAFFKRRFLGKKNPRNLKLIINKIKFLTVESLVVCLFYFLTEKGATAKGAYARWKASESSDAFWKGFVVLYIKEYIWEIVVYFSTTGFF